MKKIINGAIVFLTTFCIQAQNSTTNKNEMFDLLKQISIKAIELDSSLYSQEQIKNNWIGFQGCFEKQIDSTEKRLSIKLPKEYKDLMKITNGFLDANGISPSFCPIEKIDYLINIDPELIEIWIETGNKEVGDKMKKAIIVGGISEEQHFFLVPKSNGTWEFWIFASWIPGEEIYPTLISYFNSLLKTTTQFIDNKSNKK